MQGITFIYNRFKLYSKNDTNTAFELVYVDNSVAVLSVGAWVHNSYSGV